MNHDTVSNIIRDYGLANRGTDDDGREVYCPVCLKHRGGDGKEVVNVSRRLGITRQLIERHLNTKSHREAMDG